MAVDLHFWLTTAVVSITILLWASARLPEYLTALLFFAAATLLNIAPTRTIFSGFASSAFWLVLSGFVLGAAIRKVGLAQRWANWLVVPLSQSWPRMVAGTIALTYLLALVMPSNMGRIALLMPVVLALGERAGIAPGSRGSIGLALAVGFGTFQLSASILPANVPNLVLSGAAESAWQLHLQWMPWWLLHMPVVGLGKALVLIGCILLLFRARPQPVSHRDPSQPLSASEWRLIGLLAVTLLLWMTDSLHGLSAAWVGLAAACICLLPRIGFLSGEEFASGVNFRTCIYIAGILGVATVVVDSGLGRLIANALLSVLPLEDHPSFSNFAVLNARFTVPAQLSDADATALSRVALTMFDALGCAGVARMDFFLTAEGPVLNEVNTMPGLTAASQVPRMFAAADVSYVDLVSRLVRAAEVPGR